MAATPTARMAIAATHATPPLCLSQDTVPLNDQLPVPLFHTVLAISGRVGVEMALKLIRFLCIFLLASSAGFCQHDGKTIVALVKDFGVTEEEFDKAVGDRLIKLRTDEYEIKRTVLESYHSG